MHEETITATAEIKDTMHDFIDQMLESDSFKQLLTESLEESMASFKIDLARKLSSALVNGINYHEIAQDILDAGDLQDRIADGARSSVEYAIDGAF